MRSTARETSLSTDYRLKSTRVVEKSDGFRRMCRIDFERSGDEAVKRKVSEWLRNIREILELRIFFFFKSSK